MSMSAFENWQKWELGREAAPGFLDYLESLRGSAGVYWLYQNERLMYVGSTVNFHRRLINSVNKRYRQCGMIGQWSYRITLTEPDKRLAVEATIIRSEKPILNGNAPKKRPVPIPETTPTRPIFAD